MASGINTKQLFIWRILSVFSICFEYNEEKHCTRKSRTQPIRKSNSHLLLGIKILTLSFLIMPVNRINPMDMLLTALNEKTMLTRKMTNVAKRIESSRFEVFSFCILKITVAPCWFWVLFVRKGITRRGNRWTVLMPFLKMIVSTSRSCLVFPY